MRKMIALLLALSLLLCGCGGKEAPESASTAEAPVSEVAVSTPVEEVSAVEESIVEEFVEEIPEDPAELGKWVMALSEAADETITAYDADITSTSTVTVNGETTNSKSTGRVKELVAEDETVTYYSSSQSDGLTTDMWYCDGMVYQSDIYGSFKAPMEQEAFLEEYSLLTELEGIDENSFGLLTAEATENGYVVNYGDLTAEAAVIFMEFYGGSINDELADTGISVEITGITLDATVEVDKEGYPIRDDKNVVLTYTMAGVECTQESQTTIIYNKTGSDLIIDVPADDETFKETTDIKAAEYFITGYTLLMANQAMQYESATILTVADEADQDTYVAMDVITYTMASGTLSAMWETRELLNDETVYMVTDEYANGEGTLTSQEGTEAYAYDDATFLSDIYSFVTYNSDSFDYGLSYTMETQGEETVLTYELDAEYVEMAIDAYLAMYMPEYSLYEADALECSGSAAVSFDASGMVTAQTLNCVCEADFGGVKLTFTLDDAGALMATGGDVMMSGAAS